MTPERPLVCYKRLPNWTAETLPLAVQEKHNTKEGTWAKLTILSGILTFEELDETGQRIAQHQFTPETETPFIQPQAWHRISTVSEDLNCYLSFYCQPEDYLTKTYGITPHSDVKKLVESGFLTPGHSLDLGCGHGRNSLFLASLGHSVTALDSNQEALHEVQVLADRENWPLQTGRYDINLASLPHHQSYDFILSTVVFMFLDPERIPAIITNMQDRTAKGGYHLIVCAMDTAQHPCLMPFSFTFKEGELANYYKDWEIISYNENLGHLHRLDENGHPIELQFATLLARKQA